MMLIQATVGHAMTWPFQIFMAAEWGRLGFVYMLTELVESSSHKVSSGVSEVWIEVSGNAWGYAVFGIFQRKERGKKRGSRYPTMTIQTIKEEPVSSLEQNDGVHKHTR